MRDATAADEQQAGATVTRVRAADRQECRADRRAAAAACAGDADGAAAAGLGANFDEPIGVARRTRDKPSLSDRQKARPSVADDEGMLEDHKWSDEWSRYCQGASGIGLATNYDAPGVHSRAAAQREACRAGRCNGGYITGGQSAGSADVDDGSFAGGKIAGHREMSDEIDIVGSDLSIAKAAVAGDCSACREVDVISGTGRLLGWELPRRYFIPLVRIISLSVAAAQELTPDEYRTQTVTDSSATLSAMPDGSATLTLTLHQKIAEVPAADWDACAGDGNPFVSHAFLSAMEDSGSANSRTGWLPQHAVLRGEAGQVVAVVPMYAKSHSYGEYVFDHGWAHAFERAGGDYYPKLQVAAPFSPAPGPRLLRHPDAGVPASALASALEQACQSLNLSSVHVTFCNEDEWQALGQAGWLQRLGMQFHWENAGYTSFDDFLGALSSRKRKVLRRERRDANAAGLTFHARSGKDITEAHWDAFYRFYRSTVDRKWGSAYLSRQFFSLLGERLGDRVVLMMAENNGKPVAGALNLAGSEALYGRNWGCRGDWPFLHFELCYYRAIDWAIEHGLQRVEAGAQGRHKIQRGYLPKPTYSAHWISHAGLRRAIANFLDDERRGVHAEMAHLAEQSPFRKGDEPD